MNKKIIEKPWGLEIIIEHNDSYAMKAIIVSEGEQLSLQYHNNKVESWYIADGEGIVMYDDKEIEVSAGDHFTIPQKTIHSVVAETDMIIIEASTPELDDIVRLEDKYGRC